MCWVGGGGEWDGGVRGGGGGGGVGGVEACFSLGNRDAKFA